MSRNRPVGDFQHSWCLASRQFRGSWQPTQLCTNHASRVWQPNKPLTWLCSVHYCMRGWKEMPTKPLYALLAQYLAIPHPTHTRREAREIGSYHALTINRPLKILMTSPGNERTAFDQSVLCRVHSGHHVINTGVRAMHFIHPSRNLVRRK